MNSETFPFVTKFSYFLTNTKFPFRGSNILRNYEFVVSCKYLVKLSTLTINEDIILQFLWPSIVPFMSFIFFENFLSFPQSLHEFRKFTISRILKCSTWISTYHLFLSNLHFFIYRTTNQQAQKSGNYNKPHLSLPSK